MTDVPRLNERPTSKSPEHCGPDVGQRVHGACGCAMCGEGLRVGYRPWAAYLASAASLAGRHQASLSRYQAMVSARPAAKSVRAGSQPSSRRSLVASIA